MSLQNAAEAAGGKPAGSTFFLPPERETREEVRRQHAALAGDPVLRAAVDSSISLTAVLNSKRQAVLLNEAFRSHLGLADDESALGQRLGEYLGCARWPEGPEGCGTSRACRSCGAAQSIASALLGRAQANPCRIRAAVCGRDLTLMIRTTPFRFRGEDFLILSAVDIGHEVRRRELEQIFFHDVLNTAGGVQGLLHFMHEGGADISVREILPIARQASDTLVDELLSQRDLAAAENGDLKVSAKPLSTRALLAQLAGLLSSHPLAKGRRLVLSEDDEDLELRTDATLLSRVLLNLMKNALEACPEGGEVSVSCRRGPGTAVFLVRNPGAMPESVRNQVFQRSFSTKGAGRGLGTYSVRLLTENYLGGAVSFTSAPEDGTIFRAAYPLTPPQPRDSSFS